MLNPDRAQAALLLAGATPETRRGGNSTITRVEVGGQRYAVKDYSARSDGSVRLNREFGALTLLEAAGLGGYARPVGRDSGSCRAVFTWLHGVPPQADLVSVAAMNEQLRSLHAWSPTVAFAAAPPAADAVVSLQELIRQVESRADQLRTAQSALVVAQSTLQLMPTLRKLGAAPDVGTPTLTLSPSDFGTHNMLWDDVAQTMNFVDLEFFGWDDATKLVGDTLLHPQASWSAEAASAFITSSSRTYGLSKRRLARYAPFLALKWAAIILARAEREFTRARTATAAAAAEVRGQQALDLSRRYVETAVRLGVEGADLDAEVVRLRK